LVEQILECPLCLVTIPMQAVNNSLVRTGLQISQLTYHRRRWASAGANYRSRGSRSY
jgi:hypothetical protein